MKSFQATHQNFSQDDSLVAGAKPYQSSCISSGSQIGTTTAQQAINYEANDSKKMSYRDVPKNSLISYEY